MKEAINTIKGNYYVKKYITQNLIIGLCITLVLCVAAQTIYPLLGDGDSVFWWGLDIAIDRLTMICLLLIITRLSPDPKLTICGYIASVYYVLQLAYEIAYVANNNITIEIYQVLLGLFAVMFAAALGLIIYISKDK